MVRVARSAADITPITRAGEVSDWLRGTKREPSSDDDEDEPEAGSSTRDIARMEPAFPAVATEDTVGDPNGIRTRCLRSVAAVVLWPAFMLRSGRRWSRPCRQLRLRTLGQISVGGASQALLRKSR